MTRRTRGRRGTLVAGLLLAGAPSAAAQLPTLVLQDGPVPGVPGQSVQFLSQPRVSHSGGWGVRLGTTGAVPFQDVLWGSPDGIAAPGPFAVEGTVAGVVQTGFTAWDLGASGSVLYVASTASGPALFRDDQLLFPPGGPFAAFGDPHLADDGGVLFLGDDGAGQNVFDGAGQPLFALGSPIAGLPGTLDRVDRFSASADGGSVAAVVTLSDPGYVAPWGQSFDLRQAVVVDGQPLSYAGQTAIVGNSPGGQDGWLGFSDPLVNDAGDTAFLGFVRPSVQPWNVEFLLTRNGTGQLYWDTGFNASVWITDVEMAGSGVWGVWYEWDFYGGYFLDEQVQLDGYGLIQEGDPVDQDGDGQADPGVAVTGLWRELAVDSDYAWVILQAGGPRGLYRLPHRSDPQTYCTAKASSSGCLASVGTQPASGMPVLGASDYAATCADVQGGMNGLFFYGASGPLAVPFLGGTLCVNPPLGRMPIQNAGGTPGACDGAFAQVLNDPGSPWEPGPGDGLWIQAWYRDPLLGDGFDAALSDALHVLFL